MLKTIFVYTLLIVIMTIVFGVHTGLIEIIDPNKIQYDKSRHWAVED
jgi:hypothetical protein